MVVACISHLLVGRSPGLRRFWWRHEKRLLLIPFLTLCSSFYVYHMMLSPEQDLYSLLHRLCIPRQIIIWRQESKLMRWSEKNCFLPIYSVAHNPLSSFSLSCGFIYLFRVWKRDCEAEGPERTGRAGHVGRIACPSVAISSPLCSCPEVLIRLPCHLLLLMRFSSYVCCRKHARIQIDRTWQVHHWQAVPGTGVVMATGGHLLFP